MYVYSDILWNIVQRSGLLLLFQLSGIWIHWQIIQTVQVR